MGAALSVFSFYDCVSAYNPFGEVSPRFGIVDKTVLPARGADTVARTLRIRRHEPSASTQVRYLVFH